MTRALHIQGTGSHAGKSVLTAAFGCWLRQRGLNAAPFKAQNMSLNSFVTLNGEEVARSQAAQAEVMGLPVTAHMNPVLLKPLERGCQVVVQGHGLGVMSIQEYYAYRPQAWRAITWSYERLAEAHEAIVLEGAGSPVEINLKEHDLVNMRMAAHAGAAVVLVADIERGGVFAQLVGTWELLEPSERERVVGFIINKFRGDVSLLTPGLAELERRTGRPVLGVLPFDPGVRLEEEDSLVLDEAAAGAAETDVAVLRLPGISNFTDFASLAKAPGVAVRYVSTPAALGQPDLLVLPGTRTTVRALEWLRGTGLAVAVCRLATEPAGPLVLGICGGYQIMGQTVADPAGVESAVTCTDGLGLLNVDTVFEPSKTLTRVEAAVVTEGLLGYGSVLVGYEVHQGLTRRREGAQPWLRVRPRGGAAAEEGTVDAMRRIYGTYVHGLFDDARFCRLVVAALRQRRGLTPLPEGAWETQRHSPTDHSRRLVSWLTEHCDLRPLANALGL